MYTDQSILERLKKLEKQNRRMKRVGVAVIAVTTAMVVMGQTLPVTRVIEAHEFVLLDATGKRRAALGAYDKEGNPSLGMLDDKGDVRMLLSLEGHNPGISLNDGRASMLRLGYGLTPYQAMAGAMTGEGPYLMIADKERSRTVIGTAAYETATTGQTHKTSAASVTLFGKDNKILWKAP